MNAVEALKYGIHVAVLYFTDDKTGFLEYLPLLLHYPPSCEVSVYLQRPVLLFCSSTVTKLVVCSKYNIMSV